MKETKRILTEQLNWIYKHLRPKFPNCR